MEITLETAAELLCDCPHHNVHLASKNTWLWGVLAELERQQFSSAVEVDFRKGKALMFCKIQGANIDE